jgi:hypothetical protein
MPNPLLEASSNGAAARWLPGARAALVSLYEAWGRPDKAAAMRRARDVPRN